MVAGKFTFLILSVQSFKLNKLTNESYILHRIRSISEPNWPIKVLILLPTRSSEPGRRRRDLRNPSSILMHVVK